MQAGIEFESSYWKKGLDFVVGMDEAGRGPLAGPLVVAAVCFPKGYHHEGIYDSKKVSEKKREEMFKVILEDALEYHIEIVDVDVIDELNIYKATQKTMEDLGRKFHHCDAILTDAMPLNNMPVEHLSIIKGDQKSISIAAASILAKVVRDHMMKGYAVLYPEYGFDSHKGYGTKKHLEAIDQYGVLKIHRRSYGPIAKKLHEQLTLF